MNTSTNTTATKATGKTVTPPMSTEETKSATASSTSTSGTKSAVAKVSARFPHNPMSTTFKTSTAPATLPSQAMVHPMPVLLRSSSAPQLEWKWIPVQVETSEEMWIFAHPVDKNHQVRVRASLPIELPSLLIQPELISYEYKEQHGISKLRGHLEQHWFRIYSYLQSSFPHRIGMRRLCRLFNEVEKRILAMTMDYPEHSLTLTPIPRGTWTMFPHPKHATVGSLMDLMDLSTPESPVFLFLDEGAPDDLTPEMGTANDIYDYNYPGCRQPQPRHWIPDNFEWLRTVFTVVDQFGCFWPSYTNGSIEKVAQRCPHLQSLNVAGNGYRRSKITDAAIMELAQRCPHLQSLHLGGCCEISDTSVIELARQCPQLQSLHLGHHCYGTTILITDASVMELAQNCPKLQVLDLLHCSGITDTSIIEVAHQCPHLKSLRLASVGQQQYSDENAGVTDAGVIEVARGCPHLQSLDLYGRTSITDASVVELAQRCPHLRSLNLGGCTNITIASVTAVVQGCPQLQSLIVTHTSCGQIHFDRGSALNAVTEEHPTIDIISNFTLKTATYQTLFY